MFIHKINCDDGSYFGVWLYLLCLTSQGVKDTCQEGLVWNNNLFWRKGLLKIGHSYSYYMGNENPTISCSVGFLTVLF